MTLITRMGERTTEEAENPKSEARSSKQLPIGKFETAFWSFLPFRHWSLVSDFDIRISKLQPLSSQNTMISTDSSADFTAWRAVVAQVSCLPIAAKERDGRPFAP